MKKISLFTLLTVSFVFSFAQTSGVVDFTESIKIKIDIPDGQKELMKNMPTSQSVQKTLFFNEKESLYKNFDPKANGDVSFENKEGGNDIKMVLRMPENILYTNIEKNNYINQIDFMGKQFLIVDDVKKKSWKITGEQQKILDKTCTKAILQDTAQKLVAWFTNELPTAIRPNTLAGLPGAVLMIDMNDGQRTITANKITYRDLKPGEITVPEKGKKVNQAEFDKIKAEKMAEMGATNNGGANMRIVIRNEEH